MGLDLTSFDSALKTHYTNEVVENMVYKDNPLLALLAKYERFGGKNLPIPILWGNPQGRSASFTQAQARGLVTNSRVSDFTLIRVKDYSIAYLDNETLEASKGDANAFMEAATTEIDGAINSLTRSVAMSIYRDGSGAFAQVKSAPSAAGDMEIELKNHNDIVHIEVGMQIEFWDALTSGTQHVGTTGTLPYTVKTVDRSSGKFTTDEASTSQQITIAGNDYIFIKGDRGAKLSGLAAWIPSAAPSSATYFGVDRSVDSDRLGGLRLDGTSMPIEEALIEGMSLGARYGAKVDHAFTSFSKYASLEKALGSKVQYIDLTLNPQVGFRGILLNSPKGVVKVIPDLNCQDDIVWMLQLNTFKLYSLGKAVRVIDTDGLAMLRQASADGVEARYGFYGNVGCKAPGFNVRIGL